MRAKYNGTQLAVSRETLEIFPVLIVQCVSELTKQVTKEGGMRHDGNALFGTLVEPHEKLEGPFATVLIGFAFVRVKRVLVVLDF